MAFKLPAFMDVYRVQERVFLRLCPDLRQLEPPSRAKLVKEVRGEILWDVPIQVWTLSLSSVVVMGPYLSSSYLLKPILGYSVTVILALPVGFAVMMAGFMGVQWLVLAVLCRGRTVRHLRIAVNRTGPLLLCEACGYDLRGIDSVWCPECGAGTSSARARR